MVKTTAYLPTKSASPFCLIRLFVGAACAYEPVDARPARKSARQDCYKSFARKLNADSPLGKRIPADIADLPNTKDEADQATAHLGEVYERVAQDARVAAKPVLADYLRAARRCGSACKSPPLRLTRPTGMSTKPRGAIPATPMSPSTSASSRTRPRSMSCRNTRRGRTRRRADSPCVLPS